MPLPDTLRRLLRRVRGRLTAMLLLRRVVAAIALGGAGAAALLGLARAMVLPWAERVALGAAVALVAVSVLATLARPLRRQAVAVEADRRLGGFDRVATALELAGRKDLSGTERAQIASAATWADGRSAAAVGPLAPRGPLPVLAAVTAVAAVALALLPSPADAALAERRRVAAVLDEEAAALEEAAEKAPEEVADALRELADELRDTRDLERAITEVGRTSQELADAADPAALAKKTALAALERSLGAAGVPGPDVAAQLRALAAELATADAAARAAVADRLEARAADLAGVDTPLADALAAAAAAVRSGVGLEGALGAAAGEAERGAGEVAGGAANREARAALAEAQERLAAEARGSGQAEGSGQGQGEGDGAGAGDGDGEGDGAGQGEGAGGSPGQGRGGNVTGGNVSGGGGNAAGPVTGGAGQGTVQPGADDHDPEAAPGRSDVFDPPEFGRGEEIRVDFESGEPGELEGLAEGEGIRNVPLSPYVDRAAEYRDQAMEALGRLAVPRRVEDVVREYFTRLEP